MERSEPKKKYKCIFFDLDHTLWDYETNCADTLQELYHRYDLKSAGIPSAGHLQKSFTRINNELWDQYDRGHIGRSVIRFERFHRILLDLGLDDRPLSLRLSDDYVAESPKRGCLMPEALDILEYLHPAYPLYIITNGFDEIQRAKAASSGITKYFRKIITSEAAGHKKPSREIFDFALNLQGLPAGDAVMIGDNLLTDMAGARNAQVDRIFYNPGNVLHQEPVTHEIGRLGELKRIL